MADLIINEYTTLTSRMALIEAALPKLTKGYISYKSIGNGRYPYLQKREGDKVTSQFLSNYEADMLKVDINLRKEYEAELVSIRQRTKELEQAAKLISKELYRQLLMIKLCSGMDELSSEGKTDCASFAVAMNAVEGVPASDDTAAYMKAWQNGEMAFSAVFASVMKKYGGSKRA